MSRTSSMTAQGAEAAYRMARAQRAAETHRLLRGRRTAGRWRPRARAGDREPGASATISIAPASCDAARSGTAATPGSPVVCRS